MSVQNDTRVRDIATLELALRIADHAVRSDIECYAEGFTDNDHPWYCLDRPSDSSGDDQDAKTRALQIVEDAFGYIELRGDVFPWRIKRSRQDPRCIRFVDKVPGHD